MTASTFEQFVHESLPALMRHAYALTGNIHAAEDLVQDTLVRLSGAWRRIDRDGNPLAYTRMVMLRIYISRWRSLRRRPVPQQLVEMPARDDAYAGVEDRDSLRRGLMGLPRLQRAVLVLGYLDDMADEEIAVLLDRRPATIRSLRSRALQTLRGQFSIADKPSVDTPMPGESKVEA